MGGLTFVRTSAIAADHATVCLLLHPFFITPAGELKKVTETQHSFETVAKKAGYESLDAALADLGYVKAGAKKTAAKKSSSGRKPRVKVTDEIRAKVVASIQAGGKTIKEIAEENGLSTGTISSIKSDLSKTK